MSARWLIIAGALVPLATAAAQAGTLLESSKLVPGIVVEGRSLDASKLAPGIVIQNNGFQSSKLAPGVVVQNTGFQSSKISIGIVVQTAAGGGVIPRAPLTHW